MPSVGAVLYGIDPTLAYERFVIEVILINEGRWRFISGTFTATASVKSFHIDYTPGQNNVAVFRHAEGQTG